MQRSLDYWRPLVFGLAAAAFWAAPAPAQPMPFAERLTICDGCHGEDGNSKIENTPSLAGQPEFFLLNQLVLMREGVRRIEAMAPFVKDLSDADITALAQHYAKLPPKLSDEKIDPALVERGAALAGPRRCTSCHLPSLAGQEQMPRLARQRVDYMIHAMIALRDDKRSGADTAMTAAVYGLTDADIAALAHYSATR